MKIIFNHRILTGAAFLILIFLITQYYRSVETRPIRIGILHSLSGPMMENEKPLVETLLMAVDEINEKGGEIGVESTPGNGREFRVEFTLANEDEGEKIQ